MNSLDPGGQVVWELLRRSLNTRHLALRKPDGLVAFLMQVTHGFRADASNFIDIFPVLATNSNYLAQRIHDWTRIKKGRIVRLQAERSLVK